MIAPEHALSWRRVGITIESPRPGDNKQMTTAHPMHSNTHSTTIKAVGVLSLCLTCLPIAGGCGKPSQQSQSSPSNTDPAGEPSGNSGSASRNTGSASKSASPGVDGSVVAPDAPIVSVNGVTLNNGVFQQMVAQQIASPLYSKMPPEQRKQTIQNNVVEQFVVSKLIEQEMSQTPEFKITESDYTDALEQISKSLPAGVTVEDWAQSSGTTLDELRKTIEPQVKMKKFLDEQVGDVKATQEDIAKFYDDNKSTFERSEESVSARHILLTCAQDADEGEKMEKRELAERYRKELLEGADFAEYAGLYSKCPSGRKGGDLGTFERNKMVPEFDEAAFSLEVNEIGEVVETEFGYHIIQVLAHNQAGLQPLEDVRDQISQQLKNQGFQAEAAKYVDGLKSKAQITRPN
jgi:peptidyl-prolyl cis-trans isomerase C